MYIDTKVDEKSSTQLSDNLVWMTSAETAIYLRISANALRVAVYRGQIKTRKFRRRLYFRRIELDRMLETSKYQGGF